MEEYLKYTKSELISSSPIGQLHIVLGNEACDLDSAVSAITYAYYIHKKREPDDTTLVVPVLNIAQKQFRLRTETTHFFGKLNIAAESLTFRDDVDLQQFHDDHRLTLTLVDHNVLTGSDVIFECDVVSVVDHRARERGESASVTVKLDCVGSCCTLIAEELLDDSDFHLDDQIAELLYGTILIDTINRSPEAGKTTERDEVVLSRLEGIIPLVNGDSLFEELQNAKFNMSGLTNMEILEKDLKMVSGASMTIAMASVTMEMQEFLILPEMELDLTMFCAAKNASVAVIMTLANGTDGKPRRQIAVFSENRIFKDQIADLLDNASDPDLGLEPILPPFATITVFRQHNVKASRKKVLPILKLFLQGDKTPDVTSKEFVTSHSVSMATEGFSSILMIDSATETSTAADENNSNVLFNLDSIESLETKNSPGLDDIQDVSQLADISENWSGADVSDAPASDDNLSEREIKNVNDCDIYRSPKVLDFDLLNSKPACTKSRNPFKFTSAENQRPSVPSSSMSDFTISGSSSDLTDPFSSVDDSQTNNMYFQTGNPFSSNVQKTDTFTSDPVMSETNPFSPSFKCPDTFPIQDLNFSFEATNTIFPSPKSSNPFYTDDTDTTTDISTFTDPLSFPTTDMSNSESVPPDKLDKSMLIDQTMPDVLLNPSNLPTDDLNPFIADSDSSNPFTKTAVSHSAINTSSPDISSSISLTNTDSTQPKFPSPDDSTSQTSPDQDIPTTDEFVRYSKFPADDTDSTDSCRDLTSRNPFIDITADTGMTPDDILNMEIDRQLLYQYGARPKTRKSISLTVEVEESGDSDHDNLADLNEADFYDRIHTPDLGNSGSSSPFVNSGISTPVECVSVGRSALSSVSGSSYPSQTKTPPNSLMEVRIGTLVRDHDLPSFNNAEMVQRIQQKKASLTPNVDLLEIAEGDPTSTPYTPQNSFREDSVSEKETKVQDQGLPSLNNPLLIERIQEKRKSLTTTLNFLSAENKDLGIVMRSADETKNNFASCETDISGLSVQSFDPFTPANSWVDSNIDTFAQKHLPSYNSQDSGDEIHEKHNILISLVDTDSNIQSNIDIPQSQFESTNHSACSGNPFILLDESDHVTSEAGRCAPQNSYIESSLIAMAGNKRRVSGEELSEKLSQLKHSQDMDGNFDDVPPFTLDSGIDLQTDTYKFFSNPASANRNQSAETFDQFDLRTLTAHNIPTSCDETAYNETITDSFTETGSLLDSNLSTSTHILSNSPISKDLISNRTSFNKRDDNCKCSAATMIGISRQALREIASNTAKDLLHRALESFPDMANAEMAECIAVEILRNDNTTWTDQGSGDSGIGSSDSPQQGQPVPPRSPRSPRRIGFENKYSLETDYLPSMDPFHGNLGMLTSPTLAIETDAGKEVVEGESFRLVSGEEASPSSPAKLEDAEADDNQGIAEKVTNMIIEENIIQSDVHASAKDKVVVGKDNGIKETNDDSELHASSKEIVGDMDNIIMEVNDDMDNVLNYGKVPGVDSNSEVIKWDIGKSSFDRTKDTDSVEVNEGEGELTTDTHIKTYSGDLSTFDDNFVSSLSEYSGTVKPVIKELDILSQELNSNVGTSGVAISISPDSPCSNPSTGSSATDSELVTVKEILMHGGLENIGNLTWVSSEEKLIDLPGEKLISEQDDRLIDLEGENLIGLQDDKLDLEGGNLIGLQTDKLDLEGEKLISEEDDRLIDLEGENLIGLQDDKLDLEGEKLIGLQDDKLDLEVENLIGLQDDKIDLEGENLIGLQDHKLDLEGEKLIDFEDSCDVAEEKEGVTHTSDTKYSRDHIAQSVNEVTNKGDRGNAISFHDVSQTNEPSSNELVVEMNASMAGSAFTTESLSPAETPVDEHASGFYEVNPELKASITISATSDDTEKYFDGAVKEHVTGYYEINPQNETDDKCKSETGELDGMFVDSSAGSKLTVSASESCVSIESQESDQEVGFYEMNAEIEGTVLQNIEMGKTCSPMESSNEEQPSINYGINPMVEITAAESDSDTDANIDITHVEQFQAMADALVENAIYGAMETVKESMSPSMQQKEIDHVTESTGVDKTDSGFTVGRDVYDEQAVVSEIADAMIEVESDSDDSETSSTTTEGSYRINTSKDISPMESPDAVSLEGEFRNSDDVSNVDKNTHMMAHTVVESSVPRNAELINEPDVDKSDTYTNHSEMEGKLKETQETFTNDTFEELEVNSNEPCVKTETDVNKSETYTRDTFDEEEVNSNEACAKTESDVNKSETYTSDTFDEVEISTNEPCVKTETDVNKLEMYTRDTFDEEEVNSNEACAKTESDVNKSETYTSDTFDEVEISTNEPCVKTETDVNKSETYTRDTFDEEEVNSNVACAKTKSDVNKSETYTIDTFDEVEINTNEPSVKTIANVNKSGTHTCDTFEEMEVKLNEVNREYTAKANHKLSRIPSIVVSMEDEVDVDVSGVPDIVVSTASPERTEMDENEIDINAASENTYYSADKIEDIEEDISKIGVENYEDHEDFDDGCSEQGAKSEFSEIASDTDNSFGESAAYMGDNSDIDTVDKPKVMSWDCAGYTTKKEVYMTSAGRMSISIDILDDPTDADQGQVQEHATIHEGDEPIEAECAGDQNEAEQRQTPGAATTVGGMDRMRGMDLHEEWHEDPIPGMGLEGVSDSSDDSSDTDSDSELERPARPKTLLSGTKRKKRISANSKTADHDSTDDLLNGVDDLPTPDDLDTPDDLEEDDGELEWENDTPVQTPIEPIPEYSADEERSDSRKFRNVEIAGKKYRVDMHVIEPYKKVLSHGGYYGDGLNAIILFSGCYLPDRSRSDYQYVMDNLFLYAISTLELLVAEDYVIVYFHGATPRRQMPGFNWLKRCYQMIDRRLRKNLKGLLMVHPTLWLKTIVLMTKPFISSKFSSKLRFVKTLHELGKIVPMEYIYVPDPVQQYDDKLTCHQSSSSSTSTPSTPAP